MFIVIKLENLQIKDLREPLKNHFIGQANLFDSGRRQIKAALVSAKAAYILVAGTQKSSTCRSKAIIRATLNFFKCKSHIVFIGSCIKSA